MLHKGLIALAVAGTLVAVWLSMHWSGRDRSPSDRVEEQAVDATDVSSPVPRVPTPILESATVIGTPSKDELPGLVSPPDGDSQRESDASAPLADERARMTAAFGAASALSPKFASETRDRTWAETAEAELSGRIAQAAGLKLATLRIECRETVCRIDFTFPTREDMQASGGAIAMGAVNGTPGYETGGLILVGDDGTLTYYVRLREADDKAR